jgi:hypothetical protein
MGFRGRSALTCVQTGDWDLPAAWDERSDTREADSYKLGLVILRLFARAHDARASAPYLRYVPVELRDLLYRSLSGAAAKRPAAGEWQRALQGLLADGRLDERYPGPAPAPRGIPAAPRPAAVAPVAAVRPVAVRSAAVTAAPARVRQAPSPALSPLADRWLRRSVVALWLVAGTVVLLLVLSRLFAAAVPTVDPGGSSPAGAGVGTYYYTPGPGYFSGGRGGQAGIVQVP